MTERVKGRSVQETLALFRQVHDMLTDEAAVPEEKLEKLAALAGVRAYPSRVKCASLAWHALKAAITGTDQKISTE